jgi:hypothetical protein
VSLLFGTVLLGDDRSLERLFDEAFRGFMKADLKVLLNYGRQPNSASLTSSDLCTLRSLDKMAHQAAGANNWRIKR